jgi:hypothetical protein
VRLSLIVLRSPDPERLAEFYARAGIPMHPEQHGGGPRHFAGAIGASVLEIYPGARSSTTTFGLAVAAAGEFMERWRAAGGTTGKTPGSAVDPEGNLVLISQLRADPSTGQ